jgi:hypothetical protein
VLLLRVLRHFTLIVPLLIEGSHFFLLVTYSDEEFDTK